MLLGHLLASSARSSVAPSTAPAAARERLARALGLFLLAGSAGCTVRGEVLTCANDGCEGDAPTLTSAQCRAERGPGFVRNAAGTACVALTSAECPAVYGGEPSSDAEPLVLGLVGAPSLAPALAADLLGVQLAAEDLGAALVLPGGAGSPHVLVVACDVQPGLPNVSERTNRATRHLVEELGSPTVLLSLPRAFGRDEAATLAATRTDLVLDALEGAPERSSERFVSIAPRPADGLQALPALLAGTVEPSRRAASTRASLRLAIVGDALDETLERLLAEQVTFNGKRLAENGGDVLRVATAGAAERVLTFRPDVVLHLGAPADALASLVTLVEASWGSEGAPPVWVAGASAAYDAPPRAASLAPGRFHLLVPEAPGDAPDRRAAFSARVRARFPDAPAPTSAASYDATVLAALSALRAPSARGRARLATLFAEGAPKLDTLALSEAVASVRAPAAVDVRLVDGEVRLDVDGQRAFDSVTWCTTSNGFARSGLRWSAGTASPAGTATCR